MMKAILDKRNKSPPMQRNTIKLDIEAKKMWKNRLSGGEHKNADTRLT